jgi:hypothetical protein
MVRFLPVIGAPIADVVEARDTIVVADDCLAVDDARPAA